MSQSFTATLPDGTKVKRTSANRTYSHVIALGPLPKAYLIGNAEASLKANRADAAKYSAAVNYLEAGGEVVTATSSSSSTVVGMYATGLAADRRATDPGYFLGWRDDSNEASEADQALASYRSHLESATAAIAKLEARVAKLEAGPEFVGEWCAEGWAGNADLAAKRVATARNRVAGREVRAIAID